MEDRREKLKKFLSTKVEECEIIIKKYKRKHNRIKILYYTVITISISGSIVSSLLSSFAISPLSIAIISGLASIATAFSMKFNIENIKNQMNKKIQDLNKLKDKLDYVIQCNGDLTEAECNSILTEFRSL